MKLQDFTGGLSTRKRPQYININEGAVYTNVDSEVGSLSAVPTKVASIITSAQHAVFFNAQAEWVSSTIRKDYSEFQKILYSTDGIQPTKYDGTNTFNLGIAGPTAKAVITNTPSTLPPKQLSVETFLGGDLPDGQLFYRLINFDGTYYSSPFDFSYTPKRTRGTPDTIIADKQFGKLDLEPKEVVTTSTASTSIVIVAPIDGRSGDLYRMHEGVWRKLFSIVPVGPQQSDSTFDISANDALVAGDIAPIAGDMQYVYTFYNSADGTESAPSPVSDTLEDALGKVDVTMAVSTDPQVDKKRIYRLGGFITAFSLVAEVTNATTLYVDLLDDTQIVGTKLTTQATAPAPTDLTFISEAYAMLFGAQGSKLRFTPIGLPNSWPVLDFLQFDADITGIAPVANGVIVFTKFRSFIVLGSSPTRLSQQLLDGNQGCIDASSIQIMSGKAIWASSDGLCISHGDKVDVITRDKMGKLALLPVSSVIHDETYYLVESTGSIFAFDFGNAPIFERFELGVDSVTKGLDILYGHSGGILHKLFADTSKNESFTYKSPRFIEGRITEDKTYKKVYIYHKGGIIINILINDVLVRTKSLTGEGAATVQVPQDKQRGNFIQFDITGTGEVFEIEYEVGRGQGHG